MARKGISYELVEEVANELVAEGIQPTTRLIRLRLGTGSPNTIQRYINAWLNARPQITASEIPALTATSQAVDSKYNSPIKQVADLTRERDALLGEVSQLTENIAEQVTLIEIEQHAAETSRIELATAQQKIEAQAEKINELNQENQRLQAALEASEQARQIAEQESRELRSRQNPVPMENQTSNRDYNFGLPESPATTRRKKLEEIAKKEAIYLAAYADYWAALYSPTHSFPQA